MDSAENIDAKGFIANAVAKHKSLWRFLLVGFLNTGVDFLIFLFFMRVIGVNYLVAQTISYSFGVVNSFIMNKTWTFDKGDRGMNTPVQFAQFVALNILSLSVSLIGLRSLNAFLGVNIYLAKILITGVTWSIRYVGYKHWVFSDRREGVDSQF